MKKNNFSDEDIIRGILNDDDDALKILYKDNFDMITTMVIKNNGSYQEAKDIYQDAIIIFYEKVKNPEFLLICKIKTYLYSISKKLWLNELKLKNIEYIDFIENNEIDVADNPDFDAEVEQEKRFRHLQTSLEKLGLPCRKIIESFYFHKSSMSEIAEKMGYQNAETVKNLKYKCLQRLRKIFFELN